MDVRMGSFMQAHVGISCNWERYGSVFNALQVDSRSSIKSGT